jgi:hypothetical protein
LRFDHEIPNLENQPIEVKAATYKEQIESVRAAISDAMKIYQMGGKPQTPMETLRAMLTLAQARLEVLFDDWTPPNQPR